MTNSKSAITILTCHEQGKKAAKTFRKDSQGKIEKISFSAGYRFTHEEVPVSNLQELGDAIERLVEHPNKFIIKGQIKENMPAVVRRKMHDPDAAFDAVARPYVMLDIDKFPCPDYFSPADRPEEVVSWVKNALPNPFQNTSCYYKFSSSQNVIHDEEKAQNTVSMHLFFWCDRPVADDEWKRYFRAHSSPVDSALFNAVQPHYTATPIFEGMDDPLPKRSGFFQGTHSTVVTPEIPEEKSYIGYERVESEPSVSDESKKAGLNLITQHYTEGSRNKLCGALSSILYKKGWHPENIANFMQQLAEVNSDTEAPKRYNNAIRICEAVDKNQPVPGYPTLKKDLMIENIDEILNLLGAGKPDIDQSINQLNNKSTYDDIKNAIRILVMEDESEQQFYMHIIQKQTSQKVGLLKTLLDEVRKEQAKNIPQDIGDSLTKTLLEKEYNGGHYLLYTSDKLYWEYNGKMWVTIPDQKIKQKLLPHARSFIAEHECNNLAKLNNSVLNILEGRAYIDGDPLRQTHHNPPSVINCQNGELWFDEHGDQTLKPHTHESYLRNCLNVAYDPSASCPLFDQAIREIFSKSSDPDDMVRHFMELAGYICQPWRKIPIIVLLHGGGSNGKTSLLKIILMILGNNTVMSDRISDIENSPFKIGSLDGKLMLLDDDVDGGTCLPDGFLKKISEEKALTGEHKYKPPFEFICRAVPVMLSNDYPVTKDLSKGMRRRLLVIPFERTFEQHEIKVGLFDEIWEQEASGILNQIVAGFSRVRKREKFDEPDDCKKAKDGWIARFNTLTAFIDERCELDPTYSIPLGDFYSRLEGYCAETGIRNVPSRRTVESRLEGLGYSIKILHGKKAVWGLRALAPDVKNVLEPKM